LVEWYNYSLDSPGAKWGPDCVTGCNVL
jgi:hypothetical protein